MTVLQRTDLTIPGSGRTAHGSLSFVRNRERPGGRRARPPVSSRPENVRTLRHGPPRAEPGELAPG